MVRDGENLFLEVALEQACDLLGQWYQHHHSQGYRRQDGELQAGVLQVVQFHALKSLFGYWTLNNDCRGINFFWSHTINLILDFNCSLSQSRGVLVLASLSEQLSPTGSRTSFNVLTKYSKPNCYWEDDPKFEPKEQAEAQGVPRLQFINMQG